jgi:hypothetical protein
MWFSVHPTLGPLIFPRLVSLCGLLLGGGLHKSLACLILYVNAAEYL